MKTKDKWAVAGDGGGSRSFFGCMHENIIGLTNITISVLLMNEHIQMRNAMLCRRLFDWYRSLFGGYPCGLL
jgi:hypothetical protein